MHVLARLAAIAVLLALAAVCAFGFLSTFEPPGFIGWRIGYAFVGALCAIAAAALAVGARRLR